MNNKQTIAVFFGGRSPEHDISIVTGLQALDALDSSKYDAFPVYIATDGSWYIGDELNRRENYLPNTDQLTAVTLNVNAKGYGILQPLKRRLFANKFIKFDAALLAFHGLYGEDGKIQGLFETANIPYTGMRVMASSVLMDKAATKNMLANTDIPLLPHKLLLKPQDRLLFTSQELKNLTEDIEFPCCIKPCHLGSSIGVAKVANAEELNAVLPNIFKYDNAAIVEPFVKNLVEYNIAVSKDNEKIITSAIERPKSSSELLDFKSKYLGGSKIKLGGSKTSGASISQGMLSLTREINPSLNKELKNNLRKWATQAFITINGTGAPRIDFLCNSKTGECWLNEINPCPGSFAYFLWEAVAQPTLFTELLDKLIAEAFLQQGNSFLPSDPVPEAARLFAR